MSLLRSINTKIMVGYSAILIIFLIAATVVFQRTGVIEQRNAMFVEKTLPTLRAIEQADASLSALQIAGFGLYGLSLKRNDFETLYTNNEATLSRAISELSISGNVKSSKLGSQQQAVQDEVIKLANIMSADSVNWDGARASLKSIQREVNTMRDGLTNYKDELNSQARADASAVSEQIGSMHVLLTLTGIGIATVISLALVMSQLSIVKPTKSLSQQLDYVAEQKDLTATIAVSTQDELADTSTSVNQLISAFRQDSLEIRSSSTALLESVAVLNHSAKMSDEQVLQFSHNIESLLGTIANLEHSIEQSASRSLSASNIAQDGSALVEHGAMNVGKTSQSITDLSKNIDETADMLLELKNAGDQVSSVVKTIAEIAGQTNLLALNAAIEAARAGESGRGFAVVADEVRTLASRTHDSTHEINSILDQIVESISIAVESMESNKQKANSTVQLAEETVVCLESIQTTVASLKTENQQLTDLAKQNKDDVSAMRNNLNEVQVATGNVTKSSSETRTASNTLSELAESMETIVSRYKV